MIKIIVSLKGKSGFLNIDYPKPERINTLAPKSTIPTSVNILKLIRDKFSIKNPNFVARKFSDRVYAITPIGSFQIGMWFEIESYLKSLTIPIQIVKTAEFEEQFSPKLNIDTIETIDGFEYYDYQEATLKEFLKNGRGVSLLAPGAGKSLICGGMCKTILKNYPNHKILITVPNTYLLNQLYNSFTDQFGIDSVSKWGDNHIADLDKNILIANNQILTSDVQRTLSYVKNYDVVIVDEVHRIGDKSTKIGKVIHNIETPHKFGLTGTLPDCKMDAWNVIGKIGPILYEKNSYEIREKGSIADFEVNLVVCQHKVKPSFTYTTNLPTEKYEKELEYIINLDARNEVIRRIANALPGNVLILVDRLDHGRILLNTLQGGTKKVYFIEGDTDIETRVRIVKEMEENNGIIAVAMSTVFSTGISVNNLHHAIFACIGKSSVKLIQSIGRLVRKHESKDKAGIFDIADDLTYSYRHLLNRVRVYKQDKVTIKTIKTFI